MRFVSDGSNNDWGWKLYAVADEDPYQKRVESPGAVVLSSAHNYSDNMDEYRKIQVPGARGIEIVFAPRSSTEKNYDFVRFYKDDTHTAFWGEEKYSGGMGTCTLLMAILCSLALTPA